ncbi:hypothetical protein ACFZB5_13765 [Streptomyces nodosus]|uniref:hypothetical protein n=1 Tax=Streptomyces nodosus TaxID=40318 RepID=UPI0036E9BB4D
MSEQSETEFWAQQRAQDAARRGQHADPGACGTCRGNVAAGGQVQHDECAQRALLLPAPDAPHDELILDLSEEELASLPPRFHVPAFIESSTPKAWVCAVCWGDGWSTLWPCKTAIEQGLRVFTADDYAETRAKRQAAELAAYRALELGNLDGRVSAACGNPEHPTWLRATDDGRGCPWCRLADLETPTSDEQLAVIEARATHEHLTPGPWRLDRESCDCGGDYPCGHGMYVTGVVTPTPTWSAAERAKQTGEQPRDYDFHRGEICDFTDADWELMAHAREDVPVLLAEVRRGRTELAQMRAARDTIAELHRDLDAKLDAERERYKAGLRRADEQVNAMNAELKRYADGTETPVLWSVYNEMHSRAATAEARVAELEALKPAPIQTCRACGAGYTHGRPCSTCEFRARMAAETEARRT